MSNHGLEQHLEEGEEVIEIDCLCKHHIQFIRNIHDMDEVVICEQCGIPFLCTENETKDGTYIKALRKETLDDYRMTNKVEMYSKA